MRAVARIGIVACLTGCVEGPITAPEDPILDPAPEDAFPGWILEDVSPCPEGEDPIAREVGDGVLILECPTSEAAPGPA